MSSLLYRLKCVCSFLKSKKDVFNMQGVWQSFSKHVIQYGTMSGFPYHNLKNSQPRSHLGTRWVVNEESLYYLPRSLICVFLCDLVISAFYRVISYDVEI